MNKNSKGFAPIILVVLIIIGVLGLLFYDLLFRVDLYDKNRFPQSTPTPTLASSGFNQACTSDENCPQPMCIPEEEGCFPYKCVEGTCQADYSSITSDWKTYRNENLGFEFKYPTYLYLITDPNKPTSTPYEERVQLLFYNNPSSADSCKRQLEQFTNCTLNEEIGINLQTYPVQGSPYDELQKFALKQISKPDQYSAIITLNNLAWTLIAGGTSGTHIGHTAWTIQNNQLIMIDFFQHSSEKLNQNNYQPSQNILANQILSTFRFLDDNEGQAAWQDKVLSCINRESFLWSKITEGTTATGNELKINVETFDTDRGCLTLPEDLFPRAQRTITPLGNATLGYVSNWDEACGRFEVPPPNNCTGEGYQASGQGTVVFQAKSAVEGVPDISVKFTVK